ncbi:LOW QUALITY PROTEIN: adrenodoxin-like [Vombatus ursinus]|uniref:LOW QUALITY PROTEIN: adrenodoxin-like n=1 Tax=Vombatus ursinus TaxID=29139 RepID=UPI000FFD46C5|nr:LOW QUALITY PROTEIN: adrenodoxin-like [Vombatus ursinus]
MAAPGSGKLLLAASRRCLLFAGSRAGAGRPGWPGEQKQGSAARPRASRRDSLSAPSRHSSEDKATIHFINRDGEERTAQGKAGDSLLDVVVNNNLDIDGFGACEGTLVCSTSSVFVFVFEDHILEKLEAVIDEENDMLDLAYRLMDTSHLGCQICSTKSMNYMTVRVPEAVADARQSRDLGKNS